MTRSDEEFPRPLDDREAATLAFLLSVDAPGVEALREQARTAVVVGRCPCGCATIDLEVDPAAAPVSRFASGFEIHAPALHADPDQNLYELFVRVQDGWLVELEIVHWSGARTPTRFPDPAQFAPPQPF